LYLIQELYNQTMLDLKFIRENPDVVKTTCRNKNINPDLVDEVLRFDSERRDLITQVETVKAKRNQLNNQLKSGVTEELKLKSLELKRDLQNLEPRLKQIEENLFQDLLIRLPNITLEDVPVGKDDRDNQVIRTWGEPKKLSFTPKDHLDLGESLGIIDTNTAAKVTSTRFGYLFGDAVLLEFALVQHCLKTLTSLTIIEKIANSVKPGYCSKPFTPAVPPVMIRPEVYRRMARLNPGDEEERYYLPKDNLYLIGSAEHTLGPIFIDQTLPEKDLPIRFVGFSTAFRREAGSYGQDTRGILRVHQFDKLEIESFTTSENSRLEQDFIIAIQEYLMQSLEIPYQVVAICTGDMGLPDARQIDIESWMPSQNKYRETHTSDLMTDFQSRRLNTRVALKNGQTELVHMNDATAFAIGRTIIAILENYQQKDGSVKVPNVLIPYIGKEIISRES
jgi:seryl-tRNA synthetase